MTTPRTIALAGIALAGCFSPKFKNDLACDADGACPPGSTCGADLVCRVADGSGPMVDAGPPGELEVLATGLRLPFDIAASDDGFVYFTDQSGFMQANASVHRVKKLGGTVETLVQNAEDARRIHVAGDTVYWENQRANSIGVVHVTGVNIGSIAGSPALRSTTTSVFLLSGARIVDVPRGATAPLTQHTDGTVDQLAIRTFELHAGHIYWLQNQPANATPTSTNLKQRAEAGGNVVTVVSNGPVIDALLADDTHLYGYVANTAPTGQPATGQLLRVPFTGTSWEVMATGVAPFGFALDATHVYWTNRVGDTIMRCVKIAPCTPEVVVADARAIRLAIDGTSVFWTSSAGEIRRKRKP